MIYEKWWGKRSDNEEPCNHCDTFEKRCKNSKHLFRVYYYGDINTVQCKICGHDWSIITDEQESWLRQ